MWLQVDSIALHLTKVRLYVETKLLALARVLLSDVTALFASPVTSFDGGFFNRSNMSVLSRKVP